jgi:hypothetical protein
MKPGKSFNMSKASKVMLANSYGDRRAAVKQLMIKAEQAAAQVIKSKQSKNQENNNE